MSFTILYASLALLIMIILFLVMLRTKGLKSALIVTGAAFLILAGLLVALIGMIVNAMSN